MSKLTHTHKGIIILLSAVAAVLGLASLMQHLRPSASKATKIPDRARLAQHEANPAADPAGLDEALAHWGKVYEVFSHPRCANCHVPDDNRPRWSGPSYGETARVHAMNVQAQPAQSPDQARDGAPTLPCGTCHMAQNSPLAHGPPGAKVWALAPLSMVWWNRSSAQICEQIKDPAQNGGRSLEEVAKHIEHDALVHWGWDPGPGRAKAPYSAKETVEHLRAWAQAGAPCPP